MRRLAAFALAALLLSGASANVYALDGGVAVSTAQWSAPDGHGYVGVQANGQWAAPGSTTTTTFCSQWDKKAHVAPDEWVYWVWVHQGSCSGTIVNFSNPVQIILTGHQPGIGIHPSAYGSMSLYLNVSVEPQTAPATSQRTVSAQLTAGWIPALDNAILAYVVPSSVHVTGWTVKFGDGSSATLPPEPSDPFGLTTTHAYGPGGFDVIAIAHVSGQAYGAFFAPDGTIFEQLVPFSIDITNSASGSTAPIEYILPIVTVAGSPSGTLPDGTLIPPDAVGHAQLYWPRGLHCSLYPRADIVREGYESSGGVVIGGATTVVTGYRYEAGTNDASDATPTGRYSPDTPIAIQWDTPLANAGSYPVALTLDLQTTYADGTVRTSTVSGTVGVTVIYSAVDQ
jgi:hypothetical protein